MALHPTDRQLAAYRERTLSPLELLEVDDHLAACALCRGRVAASARSHTFEDLQESVAAVEESDWEHPDRAMLAGSLTGTLDPFDREIVEGHLEYCEECALALERLREEDP